MKETIYLGATLMMVSLIAGAALALANYYTAPIIELQKEAAIKESLSMIIAADSFKEKKGYFEAYDLQGNPAGKVFSTAVKGYSSTINALVGVDSSNKVTGVHIVSQQETPGLGTRIQEESFLNQFTGKTIDELKIKKDGGKIDGVTGATISSRAIAYGVRLAVEQSMGQKQAAANITPEKGDSSSEDGREDELEGEDG